ncbi:hypothetical protein [Amycolatopsis keratiniphila]|uniref:Uncharacterized protein n=1 Tax=Amycolatopsis keratiniphila subsp. keratiniphila TaxID=227715 RepID=A0A1W2LZA9_9PSEU|nr:hypothetical protein [Amycolatopsis keratiniphila]OLZ58768.1 hypothetical protein BS330_10140 [Amycolatopsis keratiniphila subsp. nogabecina]ONF72570.1 hypothetical protein AVR91_0210280 [Amycolatopsis keratiniphila subsp. keratiniphila]SDU69655.1 hypothetical protein SAMN04489733_8544 [Amycolatopsis keratiniphila]
MSADDGVSMDGDDVVDMYPADTAQQMTVIDAEGVHLSTSWTGIEGTLAAPNTFGHELLGAVFNERTREADASIRQAAPAAPRYYRDIAEAGRLLVKAYEARDAEAANDILIQLS